MPRPTRPELHIQRLLAGKHGDVASKTFIDYAKFADAQLSELRTLVREHRTDPRFRAEYSLPSDEQLTKYASDIEELRARAEPAKTSLPQSTLPATQSEQVAAPSASTPAKTLPVVIENPALRQRRQRSARATTGKSEGNKNEGDSLSTTEKLANEEKRREELAAEMVALAGTLKTGAKRTHAALVQEKPSLDKLAAQTETSIDGVKRETSRIQAQLGRSWSFTLCLWALVAVTMLLFFWTYFFMRTFRKR